MKNKIIFFIVQMTLSLLSCFWAQEIELPDITVIIEKPVAEKKIVYTAEEIREKNVDSLTGLLQSAGIQILSYGPYGMESKPSIRGFTDETVRVIIDGICVNNAQYGTFDFSSIDVDSIEKIEIVKGGFTEGVSDEGAVGGAIYITTKKVSFGQHFQNDTSIKSYFNADALVDSFSEKLLYSGQLGEDSFLKANTSFTFAQNRFLYQDSISHNVVERKNAKVIDGSSDVKFTQYFGDGYSFSAGNIFYAGNKNVPGPEHGNSGIQKDFDNNLSFNIRFPYLADGFSLDSNLCWLSNIRFYESSMEKSEHYVNSIKFTVEGNYSINNLYNQAIGLSFDYTNLNSTNDGIHNQFTGTFKETAKFKVNDTISFSLPLALKFCDRNFAFIPKLGVKADFEYFSLFADAYRMIQFPNMDDLYWIGDGFSGNPDLNPEEGWGGDIGISIKNTFVSADLSFFTNYYKNKIQWSNNKGQWMPMNIASAFYAGSDVSLGTELFDEHLILKLNLEYLYNKLLDKNNSQTYGKKIMWTPDWTGGFSALLSMEKFKLNLEGNFIGSRFTSNMNIYKMDPYFLLNASGELSYWENIIPYFRGENLLNVRYYSVENYPMPGMSLTVGLKLKFDPK